MAIVKEEWRKHPHWNIEVSNLGRIRKDGRIRPVTPHHSGYQVFSPKWGTQCRVHTLVLETWVGFCPPGKECRHKDDNKANNKRTNLSWGTKQQNAQDRVRNGTQYRHGRVKFSDKIYDDMFQRVALGATIKEVTRDLSMSRSAYYREKAVRRSARG